jgi:hypothetical protein
MKENNEEQDSGRMEVVDPGDEKPMLQCGLPVHFAKWSRADISSSHDMDIDLSRVVRISPFWIYQYKMIFRNS